MDAPPVVAPAPVTCERCGGFVTAVAPLGGKKLCDDCVGRVAAEAAYWPSGYLIGLGALMNVAPALVLLALNHQRLGDAKLARGYAIAGALAAAFFTAVVAFDIPIPSGALIGANIGTAVTLGRSWRPSWDRLRARGAKRANLWLPPLITLAALVAVVLLSVAVRSAGPEP